MHSLGFERKVLCSISLLRLNRAEIVDSVLAHAHRLESLLASSSRTAGHAEAISNRL
jgi:hypothetical protein